MDERRDELAALLVYAVTDEDEAILLANDSSFGLGVGRELGAEGIQEFVNRKLIRTP